MVSQMKELCVMYGQDFEFIFSSLTEPVDLYCSQHEIKDQYILLSEMEDFYERSLHGVSSISDLFKMGLEYIPNEDESMRTWFPILIEHLRNKVAK